LRRIPLPVMLKNPAEATAGIYRRLGGGYIDAYQQRQSEELP
jgi:hypothetical protein